MDRLPLSQLIDEIRIFLRKVGAPEAILFGSRARGEELLQSDIDLIVISPTFAGCPFPQRLVLLQEHWALPLFLESLAYTPQELELLRHSRGVIARALQEGIRVQS